MKKRVISVLLILTMMVPTWLGLVVPVGAASDTPQDRLNDLVSYFNATAGNKYFTVDGKSCTDDSDRSKITRVIEADWFKSKFGTLSNDQFPVQYNSSTSSGDGGIQCYGFARFAQWYLFKQSNTDTVVGNYVTTATYSKANADKYCQFGDIIRFPNVPHSVIFISSDSSGMTVLDCNYNFTCNVLKHVLPWSWHPNNNSMVITRGTSVQAGSSTEYESCNETWIATDNLRCRKGPGTDYDVAKEGYCVEAGNTMTIDQKTTASSGDVWGHGEGWSTSLGDYLEGWFCLTYATLATSTSADLSEWSQLIDERINFLNSKISYFTTRQTACTTLDLLDKNGNPSWHGGCDYCHNRDVVQSTWLLNALNLSKIDSNKFPSYEDKDSIYTQGGWSCHGFATFAEWYIFRENDSETINTTYLGDINFDYSNVNQVVKAGDILRLDGKHTVIVKSVNVNGINVLDCNFDKNEQHGFCYVQIHDISYSKYSNASVNRCTKYNNLLQEAASNFSNIVEPMYLTLPVGQCFDFSLGSSARVSLTGCTWSSSNTSVATVSSAGKVTAKAAGSTTITVTNSSGKSDTCTIVVVKLNATCAENWSINSSRMQGHIAAGANDGANWYEDGNYEMVNGEHLIIFDKTTTSDGKTWGFGCGDSEYLGQRIWGWFWLTGGNQTEETFNYSYVPSKPSISAGTVSDGKATIRWQAMTGDPSFDVYVNNEKVGTTKSTSYTVDVPNNTSVTVKVEAVNKNFAFNDIYRCAAMSSTLTVKGKDSPTSGTCGTSLSWSLNTTTGVLTITGSGDMDNYTTDSHAPWYDYRTSIKTITVENGVKKIGDNAFLDCTALTTVTLPASIDALGIDAFYRCSRLTGVYITDLAKWCEIGHRDYVSNPLFYAYNLYINGVLATDIVIPDTVDTIRYNVFRNCTSLKTITIPASVTKIDNYAFQGCTSLTTVHYLGTAAQWNAIEILDNNTDLLNKPRTYAVKETESGTCGTSLSWSLNTTTGVLNITGSGDMTDYTTDAPAPWDGYRSYIKTLNIGSGVTGIGNYAFNNCTAMTSVTIPASITAIKKGAFNNCTALTGVYITDLAAWCEVKHGNYASNPLNYAYNLYVNGALVTDLVIPDGVAHIRYNVFRHTTCIKSVTIPASVTLIEHHAFGDCSFETVHYLGTETQWNAIDIRENNTELTDKTRHYMIQEVATATCTADGVIYWACPNCSNFCRTTQKALGHNPGAAATCTTDQICTRCHAVVKKALGHTEGKTILNVGATCTDTGYRIVECAVCPETYTIETPSLGHTPGAAATCTTPQTCVRCDYVYQAQLGHIPGDEATCTSEQICTRCHTVLAEKLPHTCVDGVCTVCGQCVTLTYQINQGKVTVKGLADASVTNLVIPDRIENCPVVSINAAAFYGETGLRSVVIPQGIGSIGMQTFGGCTSLKTVTLPAGITDIARDAFAGCTALSDVYFGGTSADKAGIAFGSGNDALQKATWHFGVTPTVGDLDGDGDADNTDVTLLIRALSGWTDAATDTAAADVNLDGKVNNRDAIALIRIVAKWND